MARNGKLIVFEGIDGCGKTTILNKIYDWMIDKGLQVVKSREPGGCITGEYIRDTLLSNKCEVASLTELLLFEAARSEHTINVLLPKLESGNIVLCDRFIDSTVAYQGRTMDKGLIEYLNRETTYGIEPDLVILLDIDVDTAMHRIQNDDIRQTNRLDNLTCNEYEEIKDIYNIIANTSRNHYIVNANRSISDVLEDVKHIITANVIGENTTNMESKMKMISADSARRLKKKYDDKRHNDLIETIKMTIIESANSGYDHAVINYKQHDDVSSTANLIRSYGYDVSINDAKNKIILKW